MLTFGSCFAGLGGIDVALESAGMVCAWQIELDEDCNRVLAHHWPDVPKHRDIREVDADGLRRVDVLAGGVPCQDWSVAGKRAGLAGERSGLFFDFARLADSLKPRWILFENVPGLLSSNGGKDIATVLGEFNRIGYIPDIDICDAQFFGVPQRRRRVFIVCENAEHGLKTRSEFFLRAICLAIMQTLRDGLSALADPLTGWPSGLGVNAFAVGVRKKMKFFDSLPSPRLMRRLPSVLLGGPLRSQPDSRSSESACKDEPERSSSAEGTESTEAATGSCAGPTPMVSEEPNSSMYSSWNSILDAALLPKKRFTTLTESQPTTASLICSCAEIASTILRFIAASKNSCPFWSPAALFTSTVTAEFMNYARQASECLFVPMEWREQYRLVCADAQRALYALRGSGDWSSPQALLSLFQSCDGDSAPRRETGAGVAPSVTPGARRASGNRSDEQLAVMGFHANGAGSFRAGTPTLAASDDNGSNHVIVIQDARDLEKEQWGLGGRQGPMYTLDTHSEHAVAFSELGEGHATYQETETAASMRTNTGGGGLMNNLVAHTLKAEGSDASEDGTGRGVPLAVVPSVAFNIVGLAQQGKNHAYETDVSGCLQHKGLMPTGNEAGTVIAIDAARYNADKGGAHYATKDQADAREVLRVLRGKTGEETFQEWCLGILAALREAQVLRPGVHGEGVRPAAHGDELGDRAQGSQADGCARPLRKVWAAQCQRRASSEWGLARQHSRQLRAYLSELSQQGPRQGQALHCLWEASEGLGLLRQALLQVQEVWRPAAVQAEPAHAAGTGDGLSQLENGGPGVGQRMIVRRLTPL